MTVIVSPGVSPTGERIVRELDGIGTLTFENYGPGEWMTQKGEPAKVARRRYLLNDEPLDSVSSIVDTLRKIGLEKWKEDMGARGGAFLQAQGELDGVPEEEIVQRVRALNLGADARAREAAARGNAIHAVFHGLATGGSVPDPSQFELPARNWLQGAMRAWMTLGWESTIMAEEIACHPGLLFAGRPDLVAVCGGRRTLLDYKTSAKGTVYVSAHWQTRLYAMALEACAEGVDKIVIVGVADDGAFELINCAVSESSARCLIDVFRENKRVVSDMAAQRRIARAAA